METEEAFQSNAAKESIRPPPVVKKAPKKEAQRWKAKGTPFIHPKVAKINTFKDQVAEIAKSLEMEEKTEYGIPAEKELAVLNRKARYDKILKGRSHLVITLKAIGHYRQLLKIIIVIKPFLITSNGERLIV